MAGAGPALWMANAIAGAIATMTNGNATASARTPTASRRAIATSGEDNSITGNSAKADIDQSDTKRRPANGAIKAGDLIADVLGPDALSEDSEWAYMISFLPGLKSAGGTEEILRNNRAGTQAVMEAALKHGLERAVYTSSVATLALHPDGGRATEQDALTEAKAIGAYKRSKVAAERLVQQMIAVRGLPSGWCSR